MADVKQGARKHAQKEKKSQAYWSKNFFLSTALREIIEHYPEIQPERIVFAASVYYPIADIDLRFEERTFEDFESIEYDMLQFVADLGPDVDLLADTTGLSPTYANKLLALLTGYGHINEAGQLTEFGRQSLAEGKKIVCTHVAQRVQMDPLSLRLLKVDELIREEDLYDRGNTERKVGIIPCLDGVSNVQVAEQLKSTNLMELIMHDKGVLNANVESIQSIACAGLRFVKAVMLALKQGHSVSAFDPKTPIVFCKRLVPARGKNYMASAWMPFSVPRRQQPVIERLFHRILDEQEDSCQWDWVEEQRIKCDGKEKSRAQYERKLHSVFDFSAADVTFVPHNEAYIGMTVDITAESIVSYHRELFDWLFGIARSGGTVLSYDYWYGGVLHINTSDARIRDLSARLAVCAEERGVRFMLNYWAQEFAPPKVETGEEADGSLVQGSLYERLLASLDEERLAQYDRAING